MGLFSVRGRLAQPSEHKPPVRLRQALRAGIRNTGRELTARLRGARLAAVAATNDARIVAALLLLAAVALGLEMAASFHLL
jgi:hypothetical protein